MATMDAVQAVSRFGLGARPGELAAVGGDAQGWVLRQLDAPFPIPPALQGLMSTAEALRYTPGGIKQAAGAGFFARLMGEQENLDTRKALQKERRKALGDELFAGFTTAAETDTPLLERLTTFWANHFTVSAVRGAAAPLVSCFEREAIRPHITGRFVDLLLAAERHPAMLYYLDNVNSIGADSRAGQRQAQQGKPRGLNENLAREIMELHTLGVDGGYTQADVTAFARTLTGWSLERKDLLDSDGQPRFFDNRHEPGAQTILGRRYADTGASQSEAVLRDLAAHPATAQFIATKLVRHFVADDPPPAAVAAVAQVFRTSGGDLKAVTAAVIRRPEAWNNPGGKFRTPWEYLVAVQRLLGRDHGVQKPGPLAAALTAMGQKPFSAPSPAGWPDTAAAWLSADNLWKRLETGLAIAERAGIDTPMTLAEQALGTRLGEATRTAIRQAESTAQGLALLFASPEFNRR